MTSAGTRTWVTIGAEATTTPTPMAKTMAKTMAPHLCNVHDFPFFTQALSITSYPGSVFEQG